jgi:hypothetical protein
LHAHFTHRMAEPGPQNRWEWPLAAMRSRGEESRHVLEAKSRRAEWRIRAILDHCAESPSDSCAGSICLPQLNARGHLSAVFRSIAQGWPGRDPDALSLARKHESPANRTLPPHRLRRNCFAPIRNLRFIAHDPIRREALQTRGWKWCHEETYVGMRSWRPTWKAGTQTCRGAM